MTNTSTTQQTSNTPTPSRIGGGTDDTSFWTGGSNIPAKKLKKPKSYLARRPGDFRGAEKVETGCKAGLKYEIRPGLADEKSTYTISLTEWVREIQKKLEDGGMDTVFRLYDATSTTPERYLLEKWGTIQEQEVTEWLNDLMVAGVKYDAQDATKRAPLCDFDLDNLTWSGDMIKDSISRKFWSEIQSLLKGKTGPRIFYAVVTRLQHTTATTARDLVKKLEALKLTKEPGMDVTTFSKKVTDLIDQINDCGERNLPIDLSLVVIGLYEDTGVSKFDLQQTILFNEINKDVKAYAPKQVVEKMKDAYFALTCINKWPHKNQKSKNDEMAVMKATINTLQQKIESLKPKAEGNNNNNTAGNKNRKNNRGGNSGAGNRDM
jgi:hypothetical protein